MSSYGTDKEMDIYCKTQYASVDYNGQTYKDPESANAVIYETPRFFTDKKCQLWFSERKQQASITFMEVCKRTGGRTWLGTTGDYSKLGYNKNLKQCGCILANEEYLLKAADIPQAKRVPPECMDNRCLAEWKTYDQEKTACNIVNCDIVLVNSTIYGENNKLSNNCGNSGTANNSGGNPFTSLTKNQQIAVIIIIMILVILMIKLAKK